METKFNIPVFDDSFFSDEEVGNPSSKPVLHDSISTESSDKKVDIIDIQNNFFEQVQQNIEDGLQDYYYEEEYEEDEEDEEEEYEGEHLEYESGYEKDLETDLHVLTTDIIESSAISIPQIPSSHTASDIIGKRVQPSNRQRNSPLPKVKDKKKYRDMWDTLTDVEKYILILISEHRQLTLSQLEVLVVYPSTIRTRKGGGGRNCIKTYFDWLSKQRYGALLDWKNTFKTNTVTGLESKLDKLCNLGVLYKTESAYSIDKPDEVNRYEEFPSLFTSHYYLTERGASLLVVNTNVNRVRPKPVVGYVSTYKNAAYQTILHEAESTEILCSLISCAMYASNPEDGSDYGLFDICRFYHEKDIEEKNVEYDGKKIDFKTDGKVTLYVEQLNDFVDFYLEYDTGTSSADKIKHKVEAFIKYIFWQRNKYGNKFRKPILLLVTQKPADLFPQLRNKESTKYTTGIKNMTATFFSEYLDVINDMCVVLAADCITLRRTGALGQCWHRVDLVTGVADTKVSDLITASSQIVLDA